MYKYLYDSHKYTLPYSCSTYTYMSQLKVIWIKASTVEETDHVDDPHSLLHVL